jgi:ribosomal protein S18 acetylase RimI-like enzyme
MVAEPEPPTTIRLATPDDVPTLGGITGRAYAAAYPGIVPAPVLAEWVGDAPDMWRRWRDAMAADPHRPSRAWLAERDGMIVGYATTSPARDEYLPPPEGAGELTNLYLDPEAIGGGVGSALYDHAVADLRERGFNPFVVWAFRDNERAVRFYERKGLVIDVPDHDWVLGGVACPIVRLRTEWPGSASG